MGRGVPTSNVPICTKSQGRNLKRMSTHRLKAFSILQLLLSTLTHAQSVATSPLGGGGGGEQLQDTQA